MRPVDWAPLAETDPLPGDPDAITIEAARLSRLGEDMRSQAARLREIGKDTTLIGAYAEELRAASMDLAQDLDKVSGRYERVGSALKEWAPELTVAQTETLRARSKALEAEQLRQAQPDIPPWGEAWKYVGFQPVANFAAMDEATQLFDEAQRILRGALEHAQSRGAHCAGLIGDANDIFKDNTWDNFKDWADRNAGWIDRYSERLGYLATAAAIGAIFIPGANVLALSYLATTLSTTAALATTAAAVGHLTLASTGNGSWVDVGFDVIALVTLGIGLRAAHTMKGAHAATRAAASTEAGEEAAEAVFRSRMADLEAATQRVVRAQTAAARDDALRLGTEVRREATDASARATAAIMDAPLPGSNFLQRLAIGDPDLARSWNDVTALASRFPNAPAVAEAAEEASNAYRLAQHSYMAATAAEQLDAAIESPGARWLFTRTASQW